MFWLTQLIHQTIGDSRLRMVGCLNFFLMRGKTISKSSKEPVKPFRLETEKRKFSLFIFYGGIKFGPYKLVRYETFLFQSICTEKFLKYFNILLKK